MKLKINKIIKNSLEVIIINKNIVITFINKFFLRIVIKDPYFYKL